MLMTGHLIFDAAGNLVNQTAYSYGANADTPNNSQCQLEPNELSSWQATKFSSNGLPVFCANFTGQPLANSVNEKISASQSQAQDYLIELDFGLRTAADWTYAGSLDDLVAEIQPPVTNTQTRISLASDTDYYNVQFMAKAGDTPAYWVTNDDDMKEPNDDLYGKVNASLDPSIYVYKGDEKVGQIACNNKGPEFMIVDERSGNEISLSDFGNLSEGDKATCVMAYVGVNGKPLWDKDGNIMKIESSPTDIGNLIIGGCLDTNTDGTIYFIDINTMYNEGRVPKNGTLKWQRSLKKIPEDTRATEYESLVKGDDGKLTPKTLEMTPCDAKTVYALSEGGKKMAVKFNDDGIITGVTSDLDADGKATEKAKWEQYDGQKIYIDKAISTRTIDYNKDVSTFDDPIRAENATKAGSSSFVTQDAGQNGYASGVLSGTNISADGVVSGYYDNGETVPLYQIALYDFHNKQGLRREGGNLYAQTKESGEARQGVAGEAGFGNTKAYNIEASNVDMSREFVNMISTQRGFQANSKTITTVDTMLETVIGMKR